MKIYTIMCKIKYTHTHTQPPGSPLSSTEDASQSQMRSGRWPSPQLNAQGGLICPHSRLSARIPQQHARIVGRDARHLLLAQFCSLLGRLWPRLWRAWRPEVIEHPPNTHTALTSERSAYPFRTAQLCNPMPPTLLHRPWGDSGAETEVWKRFIALFPCGSTGGVGKRQRVPLTSEKITGLCQLSSYPGLE